MKIRRKYILLVLVIGAVAVAGLVIRRTSARPRTVGQVVATLKASRGTEFSNSFPDLLQIRDVLLIAVKKSRRLEVWTRNGDDSVYRFRKTYPFTGFSGKLGPKRRRGDRQIPEGIYAITGLNPNSREHLSIKVDYPNATDENFAKGEKRTDLGGDIFIHGNDRSIGCIPIGNRNIEELFFLVAEVGATHTTVVIMPVDFRLKRHKAFKAAAAYERYIYSAIRKELQARLPVPNLSVTNFPRGEKKAPNPGI